jgi:Zn-dependent protease with chaperone function
MSAALALVGVCGSSGIWIIMARPAMVAIIVGAVLIASDGLVLFFLIRYLFRASKNTDPGRVEITEEEHAQLFALIWQLTEDVGMPFPKKIFLSPEVNTRVFYNAGNLEIGPGLVNSININEFKAILACEFGYFSRRSTKRFVYQANYLIYNMLYDNSRDAKFMQSRARMPDVFAFFALPAGKIGKGILLILKKVYKIISKNYLTISHEISFHADAIAAGVAGGNNLITALNRIAVAGGCYTIALNAASTFMKEKKITRNIFSNQLTVLRSKFVHPLSMSRINYKNQWAGYPTLKERIQRLDSAVPSEFPDLFEPDDTTAWELFNNAKALQETLTANLYREITQGRSFQFYEEEEFDTWYQTNPYKMPAVYKGFYDQRYIDLIAWDLEALAVLPVHVQFGELFNEENGQLPSLISRNEKDIATLKAIKEKHIRTESFDFEGTKYVRSNCDTLIAKMEEEIVLMKEKLFQIDKQAFAFFYQQNTSVMVLYQQYQAIQRQQITFSETAGQVMQLTNSFYSSTLTSEELKSSLSKIAAHEIVIKRVMRSIIEENIITPESPLYTQISNYINAQYVYFSDKGKHDEELYVLSEVLTSKIPLLEKIQHKYYRKMVEGQLSA